MKEKYMDSNIQKAIDIFKKGGIVIFPTDTVYGIGCRMDAVDAVERLFAIRRRPKEKAMLVLVNSVKMAKQYLQPVPPEVADFMNTYWAGPLTIIFPCRKEKVPGQVRGRGKTLGMRMPDNPILLEIITQIGVPLVAPSANFSGKKTPRSLDEVDPELIKLADFVLSGECGTKQSSTIIDCSTMPFTVVREGAIHIV